MKKLLIVVDYQKDFVDGVLGFPKSVALEQPIADKITEYRKNGDEIVFTLDTHNDDYLTTQEGRNMPILHCGKNSEGFKLYGQVAKVKDKNDMCFIKDKFGSDKLFLYLQEREYESIELVGVVSNICVITNAVLAKTALPETPIIVDAACVASNDDKLNEEALDIMESLQIKIIGRQ